MIVRKNEDLSLEVTMSAKEAFEGLLLSIMKNSTLRFLPYRIKEYDSTLLIPDEFTLKLEYIMKGEKA